jgi:hypothetical protein
MRSLTRRRSKPQCGSAVKQLPALFTRVRDETAETASETSGEPARRQACRSRVSAVAVEAFMNYAG